MRSPVDVPLLIGFCVDIRLEGVGVPTPLEVSVKTVDIEEVEPERGRMFELDEATEGDVCNVVGNRVVGVGFGLATVEVGVMAVPREKVDEMATPVPGTLEVELNTALGEVVVELLTLLGWAAVVALTGVTCPTGHTS